MDGRDGGAERRSPYLPTGYRLDDARATPPSRSCAARTVRKWPPSPRRARTRRSSNGERGRIIGGKGPRPMPNARPRWRPAAKGVLVAVGALCLVAGSADLLAEVLGHAASAQGTLAGASLIVLGPAWLAWGRSGRR